MNFALGLETPVNSFNSLPSEIEMLILDSVVDNHAIDCPIEITKEMAASISHTGLKMISLDRNTINKIDPDAFSVLLQSLQQIRIRANKFELGWYMLYAYQLTNVKTIEASYAHMGLQCEAFSNVEHPSLPSVEIINTAVKKISSGTVYQ
ncbi:hypothetical protein DPMN_140249 [Dreissena polymorpha]|uniref:Uncharacterized protein n=1 Tax=Dreissena polymorpha TaxID=45954 RepID=A0A9D4JIV3_DREPO|nr:hypothetical protein DPMN_140249 [Dreissena polymorpha]